MPFLFPLHFTARPFADSGGCLCSQLCLIVQTQHCLWHRQFSSGFWPWLWSDFVRQGEAFSIFNRVYVKFNPFYLLRRVGIDVTQNVMTLICAFMWARQQPIAVTAFTGSHAVSSYFWLYYCHFFVRGTGGEYIFIFSILSSCVKLHHGRTIDFEKASFTEGWYLWMFSPARAARTWCEWRVRNAHGADGSGALACLRCRQSGLPAARLWAINFNDRQAGGLFRRCIG